MFRHRTTPLLILLLLVAFPSGQGDEPQNTEPSDMTYQIRTTWDDRPLKHDPVTVSFVGLGDEGVEIKVDAPFFGLPGNPGGEPGKPFDKLWEYEVVEVFFSDGDVEKPKYVEVELCPWGQHLVLLLDGVRNDVRKMLPITFTASINGNRWNGTAIIPAAYFPPKVTRFNAYAIHDVNCTKGDPRRYEALFPVPTGKYEAANFHRLDYFQPINFELLQPGNSNANLSGAWPVSMLRKLPSQLIQLNGKTLGGGEQAKSHANLTLTGVVDGENAMLNINLTAFFINNGSSTPTGPVNAPLDDKELDSYETVRAYLINGDKKILELDFSPYGYYDVKLYSAPYNLISRGHRIDVNISKPVSSKWSAAASIPLELLPANIDHANVAAVYKMGNVIQYEASYVITNAGISLPDLMVTASYSGASGLFPEGVNDAYSDLWDQGN